MSTDPGTTLRGAQDLTPIASWGDVLDLAHLHDVDPDTAAVWFLETVDVADLQQDLGLDDDPDERAYLNHPTGGLRARGDAAPARPDAHRAGDEPVGRHPPRHRRPPRRL